MNDVELIYEAYLNLLQEKYFSYTAPDSVRLRIYDFYVLSYLNFLVDKMPVKNYRYEDTELKASVKDACKIIASTLRESLLEDVLYAIVSETTHAIRPADEVYGGYSFEQQELPHPMMFKRFDNDQDMQIYTILVNALQEHVSVNPFDDLGESRKGDIFNATLNILKKHNITVSRYVKACKSILNPEYIEWSEMYAGQPWIDICDGWLRLYYSKVNSSEEQVAIDHIFDLEHNNGSVLNKKQTYSGNWLKRVLDHKRDAESMYELIPHASGPVSSMAQRVLKERLGTTIASSRINNFTNLYNDQERDTNLALQEIQRYIKTGSKGTLDLSNTSVLKLPDNLTVNGDLVLNSTGISDVPTNLTVAGTLYIANTPLSQQHTLEQLRAMLPNVARIWTGRDEDWGSVLQQNIDDDGFNVSFVDEE